MSRAQTAASLARWQALKAARYRRWRSAVRRLPKGHPARARLHARYVTAREMVSRRRTHLSRMAVTTVSETGVAAMIDEEGIRNYPYLDSRGFATVFVGRLLGQRGITAADTRKYGTRSNPRYTRAEAVAIFRREDLPSYERAVARALKASKVQVTQAMFDACVSLAFNIGVGGFAASTVVRELRAGHKRAAADAILFWNQPPELRARRERERSRFLS